MRLSVLVSYLVSWFNWGKPVIIVINRCSKEINSVIQGVVG